MKKIFFSFSDNEEEFKIVEQFIAQAQVLIDQGKINLWHKKKLLPGDESLLEVDKQIREADIFIFFSSINHYIDCEKEKTIALTEYYKNNIDIIEVRLSKYIGSSFTNDPITYFPKDETIVNLINAGANKEEVCANVFENISIHCGLIPGKINEELLNITNAKGTRLFLDSYFPKLHHFFTKKFSSFKEPAELLDIEKYFAVLKSRIKSELYLKTYIPLAGKEMPFTENTGPGDNEYYYSPNEIRYIFGKTRGGDAENAQIAGKSHKNKLVKNIKKTLLHADDPMILLGDPGTGKTMTIQQSILDIIRDGEKRIFPVIPIYVKLGEFNTKNFELKTVEEFIKRNTDSTIKPYFDSLLRSNKRLIIFFDGLDEMSREGYNEKIKLLGRFADAFKHHCLCLFSCRINDFSSVFEYHRLVILPLENTQIRKFLTGHKIQQPVEINNEFFTLDKLVRKLSSGDLPMEADNPFILWLFCNFIVKEKRWPNSRVELMKSFVQEIYYIKTTDLNLSYVGLPEDVEIIFKDWGLFAYLLTEQDSGTSLPVNSLFEKFSSPDIVFRFITAGKICNVLRESRDGNEHLIKFEHQRYQEYFAAYFIYKNNLPINWLEKLDIPRWQETLLNYILLSNEENSIKLLAQSIQNDFEGYKIAIEIKATQEKEKAESKKRKKTNTNTKQENSLLSDQDEEKLVNINIHDTETLLTDKIELGSRLVKQLGTAGNMKNQIVPLLNESLYYVAEYGNPVSKGKMLLACQNMLNETDRQIVIKHTIRSKISWIRNQALVLTTRNLKKTDTISNFASEVGLGIIKGDIIKNMKTYYIAARDSGIKSFKTSFFWGIFFHTLKALTIFFAAYLLLTLTEQKFNKYNWFLVKYHWIYISCIFTFGLVAYRVFTEKLWSYLIGFTIISIVITIFILYEIEKKEGFEALLTLFAVAFFLVILIPFTSLIFYLLDEVIIFIYTLLNTRKKDFKSTFYTLSGATSEMYDLKEQFSAFTGILIFAVGITLLVILNSYIDIQSRLVKLINFLQDNSLVNSISVFAKKISEPVCNIINLPYSFVAGISAAILIVLLFISLLILIKELITGRKNWKTVITTLALALIPGFVLLMCYIKELLTYLNRKFPDTISLVIIVLIPLLCILFFIIACSRLLKAIQLRYWRKPKFPKNNFTIEEWKKVINTNKISLQAEILDRSEFYSVGFETNKEFLNLLIEVEGLIKNENPALEMYWTKRKKIEEEIKQERK